MKMTYSLGKRLLALVVTMALVLSFMPSVALTANAAITTADVVDGSKKVDPSTIHNWKQYFDIMSTEYTGGVWSDKSVFNSFADYQSAEGVQNFVTPAGNNINNAVKEMLATDPENFLVTMSAITANKSLSGSASTPMDTMLVLDVSGSMQGGDAVAVVQATNQAIETLLKQNTNNRVGVVLYSGNHQFGNSRKSTASVLLPLGRYTTTDTMTMGNSTIPAYLTISGSGDSQTVSVADSVDNGTATDSKAVRGGTYIQNGLYQAWEQFEAITDTKVPEGQVQAGAQRTPVVILMSDGAPTAATTSYNNVDTSNLGDGGSTTNRIGFMTQLTAAWLRGKLQTKYNNTAPKFYTLGVGTGNDDVATSVLNPAGSNNDLTTYWTRFNAGTVGRNVLISGNNWNGWSVYKDAAVQGKNYVDQYWLTDSADGLINAFKQIVNTIVLESERYSTLVDVEDGAELSGYVTFEDELGQLMEVKAVKGLVIGESIFTGAELAKGMTSGVLGTVDGPTEAGHELVRTVKERMGITETTVAQQLVDNAFNAKQLNYVSATEYSNYIGWYADENGKYVGFWQESDGYDAANAPEGAKYINKSYGYLGEPLDASGAGSDLMHVVVMVHTEIATGHQTVVYKIPASLIPAVTYNVELNGQDVTDVKSITREGADPMRLLVEVGLRSDINAVNLEQKVAEHIEKGGHIHENQDGTYSFYTNSWGSGDGDHEVDYDEPLTHLVTEAHFHPALENDRYYHVIDDTVYSDQNGTVYNGASAPSGTGYYFARPYYEVVGGTAKQTVKYAPLGATSAAKAVKGDNGWYIPAGTPHQLTRFAATKTQNTTGTLNYSWNPVLLHDDAGYNSYTFLGNNGTFTIAPAQGIALTKNVTETVANAPTEFTFTVTLSQAVADPAITDLEGNALSGVATVRGNVITVKLKDGDTVVISGLPTGVTYTVAEESTTYYSATIENATGTIVANTITKVEAENAPKVYNDLIVSKDVTHPFVTVPNGLTTQAFTVSVDLDGEGVANTDFAVTGLTGVTSVHTDADGKFSVQIRDGESFTVKNLPSGTSYTVTETNLPAGYTLVTESTALTGTIQKGDPAQAHLVNDYDPAKADTTLTITGTKTVDDDHGVPYNWTNKSFQFKLEAYDPTTETYTQIGQLQTVTANGGRYTFGPLTFDTLGSYYYKVSEVIPDRNDREQYMSYDATAGRIVVHVTDNNVDGKLEITVQDAITGETVAASNDTVTFTKNFVNVYEEEYRPGYLEIPVKKAIEDDHNTGVTAAGFLFGMYKVENGVTATTPTYTVRTTGADGMAYFHIPFAGPLNETYVVKEIIPADADKIPGMDYDTTEYTVSISVVYDANDAVTRYTIYKNGQPVNEAAFTNTMDLTPASQQFTVNKTVTGNPLAEDYTFTLTETDGSFATPKQGGVTDTVKINGTGAKVFKEITYTAVGTHYYVVKETPGTNPGMTYDASEYHITVNVTFNNGTLVANTAITKLGVGEVQSIDFTNTYRITQPANVTIHGIKNLTGRELIAGEFELGLYENGSLKQSVKNATNGKFTFTPITYTVPGTYVYTVKEIVPATKLGGVTYDENSVYTITVEVKDNGTGGLKATETITKSGNRVDSYDDVVITNTYRPAEKSITLSGNKTWFDTDAQKDIQIPAGKFSFSLYRSNETYTSETEISTTTNQAGGAFSFSMKYTKGGTHYYILRENAGDDATVSYDAGRYLIQDVVTDDGKGQLHVMRTIVREGVGQTNAITFGNLYTPVKTEYAISGAKVLTTTANRPIVDGEFTFELYENGELVGTAENVGNTFTFDAITYEKSGTYTYTVKEKIPAQAVSNVYKGVTYDTRAYTVTVTVADVNGQLTATASHTAAQVLFENMYEGAATSFSLSGKKQYNKTLTGGEFTFELYDKNNVHIASTTNKADGTYAMNNIPLAAAGTYTFTLKEKVPAEAVNNRYQGIFYSTTVYDISVTVTDDQAGNLQVTDLTVTRSGTPVEANALDFENVYTVAPTAVDIRAYKQLKNRDLAEGEFTFVLYDENNTPIKSVSNNATGTVLFSGVQIPGVGEYQFTIREAIPDDAVNNTKDGVTYTTNELKVTVTATDNGDGTLATEVTYGSNDTVFVNEYNITGPATFSLEGTKVMEGRQLKAEDVFTFILKDKAGNPVTAKNSGAAFKFENIELNTLGDHHFTVTEQAPAGGVKDGVTYSTQVYDIYVHVSDNGKGKMVASAPVITYGGVDVTAMTFTNTYKVTEGTHVDLLGKKTLEGKALHAEQFTFELYAGTDTTAQPIATAKNEADGTIKFENVKLNTLGTNTFTVIEKLPDGHVNGKLSGISYSTLVYTVTVETTDNGKGGMIAGTPVYSLGAVAQNTMEFVNVYAVEGEVSATIEGIKTLKGGKKLEENMFAFELYEGNQPTGTPIARVQNAADGSIKFNLTYDADDIGKHTYTVKEVAPEGYVADGIRYTYLFYNVDIEVVDNNAGGLTVKAPVYRLGDDVESKMEFVNVYTPEDTTVKLTVKKLMEILSGTKKIGPEDFQFKITDEAGKTVATIVSDKNGDASHTLTFSAADIGKTLKYQIVEVDTGKTGVTYSDAKYDVSITVGQKETGELTTAITVNNAPVQEVKAVFRNTFEVADTPKTGDNANLTLYAVMMAISALGFVAMLVLRKKETQAN